MSIVITILITILIFGIIITIHEFGHFIVAKLSKIQVNEFSIGMGPALLKKEKNGTQYTLRLLPFGGYVQMEGEDGESENERAFHRAPILKRIAVVLAGAFMNFVLGILLMGIITGAQSSTVIPIIGEVTDTQSQLQVGDRLLKVNGHSIVSAADFNFQLSRISADDPVTVVVKRDGEKVTLNDAAFPVEENGQSYRSLGARLEVQSLTVSNFISNTFGNSVFYGKLVWTSLADLVTGKVSVGDLSGPVGVAQAVGEAQSQGVLSVLSLFAFITINVGLFNLLPFPALDGGRFVFLLIEAVRRKPIKREIEGYINAAGLALLMLLMVFVTIKDIVHLF